MRMAIIKFISIAFLSIFIIACSAEENASPKFDMASYLEGMPKAELHLHLEGTLSHETIVELSNRNNLDYFNTVEEVQQSLESRSPGLMGFLEHHFRMQNVMITGRDFYNATYNLAEELKKNNIVYVDMYFDPQAHTSRGIEFIEMFENIDRARMDAQNSFGITMNLIMSIQREKSTASAMLMLAEAYPYRDKIIGIGMDSGPEYGNPPIKFEGVYALAREQGYKLTGHHDVDVQDSIKHMWQSLDVIKMDRIDHGLNASDEPELMQAFIDRGICLTGSPVKRKSDPALQDIGRLTILMDAGVCVSINSDDPAEFDTKYLSNMMVMFQRDSGFTAEQMTRFMLNAFRAIWLSDEIRNEYIKTLEQYALSHGVNWQKVIE
jgi:adenine deaminase